MLRTPLQTLPTQLSTLFFVDEGECNASILFLAQIAKTQYYFLGKGLERKARIEGISCPVELASQSSPNTFYNSLGGLPESMQLLLRRLVREYMFISARTATVVICSSPYPADSAALFLKAVCGRR